MNYYLEVIDEHIKEQYSIYGEIKVKQAYVDGYMITHQGYNFVLYSKSLGQDIGKIDFLEHSYHHTDQIKNQVDRFFEFYIDVGMKRRMMMNRPLTLDQLKNKSKKTYKFIRPVRF